MLRSVKDIEDYTIGATDGIIGRVKDFYFDDDARPLGTTSRIESRRDDVSSAIQPDSRCHCRVRALKPLRAEP